MTTSADRARTLAAKFSPPGKDAAKPPPAAPPAPRRVANTRPIRSTVDLPPARHHDLQTWQNDQASMLGVARVSRQDVFDEMAHLLLTDKTTELKLVEALKKRFEER